MNKISCRCACHTIDHPDCKTCFCKRSKEFEEMINIIQNNLEASDRFCDNNHSLIKHALEGIEKLFERVEKIEVYFDELKKLINKVYYQQGVLQGLDRRITEIEKDYLD